MSILNPSKEETYLPDRFRYLEIEESSSSTPYPLNILAPVAILNTNQYTDLPDLSDSEEDDIQQN